MKKVEAINEAWFFTSELEGQRAGSFRQERWCRVFIQAGVPIRIFNVQGAFGLTTKRFESETAFAAFRQDAFSGARPRASVREGVLVRSLRRIKHLFLVDLYYPNIFYIIWTALLASRRTPGRVLIMTSSPPFSLAVAGAVVEMLRPRKIMLGVDMRDAWAMHRSLGGVRFLKRLVESFVLKRAACVSTVSYGLKEEFQETCEVEADVLYNVATHYFDVSPPMPVDWQALNPRISDGRIKLVYTGSTPEGFYDLNALVRAMVDFRRTSPELADRIQLVFVGACDEMRRELKRHGCEGDDVVFISHVAHEQAKAIQQNADSMLYLTYCGKGAVSTKIFEYFALGKPIFPLFVPPGSDVDRLLTTYGGGTYNLHSPDEIVAILRRVAGVGGLAVLPCVADPASVRGLFDDYRRFVARFRH